MYVNLHCYIKNVNILLKSVNLFWEQIDIINVIGVTLLTRKVVKEAALMDKEQKKRLAELALQARKSTDLSQRAFVRYLQADHNLVISYSALQNLENGRVGKINPDFWRVLAPLAGYTYQEAISYIEGENSAKPTTIEQVLRGIEELPISDLPSISIRIAKRLDKAFSEAQPA